MARSKRQIVCSNPQEYFNSLTDTQRNKIAKASEKHSLDAEKLKELMFHVWSFDEGNEMNFGGILDCSVRHMEHEKKTCIRQTSNYTSQAEGLITRGDMIAFAIMMSVVNDGDIIWLDQTHLTMHYRDDDKIIVTNEDGEIVAGFGEQSSWYSDWASKPCKWIGCEYFVDDIKDL